MTANPSSSRPNADAAAASTTARAPLGRELTLAALFPYFGVGLVFGFVALRSEIVSWYRIQEMFRFQSFHMYGIIGSAILVAAVSLWIIRRHDVKTFAGQAIAVPRKARTWSRYLFGGVVFGLGWALVGACPGPIFALIGAGFPAFIVVLAGALLGTFVYGAVRDRLPH